MITEGIISLIDGQETVVASVRYCNLSKRRRITDHWKKLYASGFKKCYLQIAPEVNSEMVNTDGTNRNKEHYKTGDGKYIKTLHAKDQIIDLQGARAKNHIYITRK